MPEYRAIHYNIQGCAGRQIRHSSLVSRHDHPAVWLRVRAWWNSGGSFPPFLGFFPPFFTTFLPAISHFLFP